MVGYGKKWVQLKLERSIRPGMEHALRGAPSIEEGADSRRDGNVDEKGPREPRQRVQPPRRKPRLDRGSASERRSAILAALTIYLWELTLLAWLAGW